MNALREIQDKCYDAIVLEDWQSLRSELAGAHVIASVGHLVYRNNFVESTLKTLGICYPVVQRLVGRECLRTLGRDYRVRFPSKSGNLDAFGESFPQFLAELYGRSPYAYLADVARLEWAISRLVDTPAEIGANLDWLRGIDAERFADLCWMLSPSVALVRSKYPIHRIWSVNVHGDDSTFVNLDAGGESVLITATGRQPQVHPICDASAEFIDRLNNGFAIGPACDAALTVDPVFDLSGALRLLVSTRAVAAISGADAAPSDHITRLPQEYQP